MSSQAPSSHSGSGSAPGIVPAVFLPTSASASSQSATPARRRASASGNAALAQASAQLKQEQQQPYTRRVVFACPPDSKDTAASAASAGPGARSSSAAPAAAGPGAGSDEEWAYLGGVDAGMAMPSLRAVVGMTVLTNLALANGASATSPSSAGAPAGAASGSARSECHDAYPPSLSQRVPVGYYDAAPPLAGDGGHSTTAIVSPRPGFFPHSPANAHGRPHMSSCSPTSASAAAATAAAAASAAAESASSPAHTASTVPALGLGSQMDGHYSDSLTGGSIAGGSIAGRSVGNHAGGHGHAGSGIGGTVGSSRVALSPVATPSRSAAPNTPASVAASAGGGAMSSSGAGAGVGAAGAGAGSGPGAGAGAGAGQYQYRALPPASASASGVGSAGPAVGGARERPALTIMIDAAAVAPSHGADGAAGAGAGGRTPHRAQTVSATLPPLPPLPPLPSPSAAAAAAAAAAVAAAASGGGAAAGVVGRSPPSSTKASSGITGAGGSSGSGSYPAATAPASLQAYALAHGCAGPARPPAAGLSPTAAAAAGAAGMSARAMTPSLTPTASAAAGAAGAAGASAGAATGASGAGTPSIDVDDSYDLEPSSAVGGPGYTVFTTPDGIRRIVIVPTLPAPIPAAAGEAPTTATGAQQSSRTSASADADVGSAAGGGRTRQHMRAYVAAAAAVAAAGSGSISPRGFTQQHEGTSFPPRPRASLPAPAASSAAPAPAPAAATVSASGTTRILSSAPVPTPTAAGSGFKPRSGGVAAKAAEWERRSVLNGPAVPTPTNGYGGFYNYNYGYGNGSGGYGGHFAAYQHSSSSSAPTAGQVAATGAATAATEVPEDATWAAQAAVRSSNALRSAAAATGESTSTPASASASASAPVPATSSSSSLPANRSRGDAGAADSDDPAAVTAAVADWGAAASVAAAATVAAVYSDCYYPGQSHYGRTLAAAQARRDAAAEADAAAKAAEEAAAAAKAAEEAAAAKAAAAAQSKRGSLAPGKFDRQSSAGAAVGLARLRVPGSRGEGAGGERKSALDLDHTPEISASMLDASGMDDDDGDLNDTAQHDDDSGHCHSHSDHDHDHDDDEDHTSEAMASPAGITRPGTGASGTIHGHSGSGSVPETPHSGLFHTPGGSRGVVLFHGDSSGYGVPPSSSTGMGHSSAAVIRPGSAGRSGLGSPVGTRGMTLSGGRAAAAAAADASASGHGSTTSGHGDNHRESSSVAGASRVGVLSASTAMKQLDPNGLIPDDEAEPLTVTRADLSALGDFRVDKFGRISELARAKEAMHDRNRRRSLGPVAGAAITIAANGQTAAALSTAAATASTEWTASLSDAERARLRARDQLREQKWADMLGHWRRHLAADGPASPSQPSQFNVLKRRVRKGVPPSMRGIVWPALLGLAATRERLGGTQYYKSLLQKPVDPAVDTQIRKDLPRVMQEHLMFRSPEPGSRHLVCQGQVWLYNILRAYSIHDPAVGYVQGMDLLVAPALLYMPEEMAFWFVERVLNGEHYRLRGLYVEGMPRAGCYMYVFTALMRRRFPRLSAVLEEHLIRPETFAFRWFALRFVTFAPELFYHVLDAFLLEGDKVLYRVALALVGAKEHYLLKNAHEADVVLVTLGEIERDYKWHRSRGGDEIMEAACAIKLTSAEIHKLEDEYYASMGITEPGPAPASVTPAP